MKVISFQAENIKKLVAVEIKPEGNLVEITGKNGQGKTSILDAIWWALDGNKVIQSKPVREGSEAGFIRLDLGDYVVTKKFKVKADGDLTISLTVENRDGAKFGSPQELLNRFLGDLTFDPLSFSRMRAQDQVKALRSLVKDYDFDAADKESKELFTERTDVNRSIRDLKARIESIVIPECGVSEKVSVEDLVQDLQKAMDHNAAVTAAESKAQAINGDIERTRNSIANKKQAINDLQHALNQEELRIEELNDELDGIEIADRIDTNPIREKISEADEINGALTQIKAREELVDQMKALQQKSDELTKGIDAINQAYANAVVAANLPIAGLQLTDEAVILNGQPFEQASDAEQLRASIAVAAAMNPTLRVIRVRDGSLLDADSMALLTEFAQENDTQVWIETVSSGRETAVVIEDGHVASGLEAAE